MATDPKRPAKAAAILNKGELIKKRKTAPSAGPGAWTQADFEELLEVAVLHEPRCLTQRCLGAERRIRGTKKVLGVKATLVRQLERIQHILWRTWAERCRKERPIARPRPLLLRAVRAAQPTTRRLRLLQGGAKRPAAPVYHHPM